MHLLFEDEGDLKVGAVLSSTEASYQVEFPGGKRTKIKSANVLLRFERPPGAHLLEQARRGADGIDLDFLWECAPQQEFGFQDLGREYFGHEPDPIEAASILIRLHSAPVYFHRKGKGRFKPAAPDVLQAALAAVARRREQEQQRESYLAELLAGRCPPAIRGEGAALLLRPDKNSPPFKAVEQAARERKTTPVRLLLELGAIGSAYEWHLQSFLARSFPRGAGFGALAAPPPGDDQLPLAAVEAFSIDDSSTTEIDDAFSVSPGPQGQVRVGIHIAAPAAVIARDDPIDDVARARLSTVYAPGMKITMLPPSWIEGFSLDQGRIVPVLSLYLDVDSDAMAVQSASTVVERIRIAANLRHDELAEAATEQALRDASGALPFGPQLATLWRFATALLRRREAVRGRPEASGRVDYSFELQGNGDGAEVIIRPRVRDAPLDRIVAELMIFANAHWGGVLAQAGVAGIYRSQSLGRVRMSTTPAPHEGIGVPQYAWCTSPLRRYVDLVNQRQLLAVVRGAAPAYDRNDAQLFAVVSAFDAAYALYGQFQQAMERFWCLRWLEQQSARWWRATVLRGDLIRLDRLPLVVRLAGLPALPRGRCIELELLGHDLLDLSLDARLHRVLEDSVEPPADDADAEEASGDADPLEGESAAGVAEAAPEHPPHGLPDHGMPLTAAPEPGGGTL